MRHEVMIRLTGNQWREISQLMRHGFHPSNLRAVDGVRFGLVFNRPDPEKMQIQEENK